MCRKSEQKIGYLLFMSKIDACKTITNVTGNLIFCCAGLQLADMQKLFGEGKFYAN